MKLFYKLKAVWGANLIIGIYYVTLFVQSGYVNWPIFYIGAANIGVGVWYREKFLNKTNEEK